MFFFFRLEAKNHFPSIFFHFIICLSSSAKQKHRTRTEICFCFAFLWSKAFFLLLRRKTSWEIAKREKFSLLRWYAHIPVYNKVHNPCAFKDSCHCSSLHSTVFLCPIKRNTYHHMCYASLHRFDIIFFFNATACFFINLPFPFILFHWTVCFNVNRDCAMSTAWIVQYLWTKRAMSAYPDIYENSYPSLQRRKLDYWCLRYLRRCKNQMFTCQHKTTSTTKILKAGNFFIAFIDLRFT